MKKTMISSVSIAALMLSSTAFAKPLIVKDWALDDTSATSCLASTNRTINNQNYRLELSLDKSGLYPVEVWIREVPTSGTTRAFKFTTEMRPIQNFAFAPFKDSEGNQTFWQVPSDTASLISYLKRETRMLAFALTPNGAAAPTAKAVDFSLRGSSAVIDALIAQCNQNKVLTQSSFELSFVPAITATLDALKLDEEKAAQLRSIYMGALVATSQKAQLQKELTALNTQYAKQIQELAKVTGTLDQLTQQELTSLQNQKKAAQSKIVSLEQQILNQKAAIEAKESEIVKANANYDAAWKVLAPFEAEHKRLADSVSASRNDVASAQSRLADIDAQVNSKVNALSRAENEVNSLRNKLSQADNDLRNLRLDVDNTDSDLRRFEDRRERGERLREHPLLRFCEQQRSNVCDSVGRNIEAEIHREVDNIRNRFSSNSDLVRSRLSQKNDQISSLSSQIRDYADFQIPTLRGQLTDLRNQRPGFETRLANAKNEVSQRSSALNSYDASVGYAAKKSAMDSASSIVISLRADLAKLDGTKAALIRSRDAANAELAATDKKIELVLVKIQETQGRSSELNQALVPYFEQKSRIEVGLTSLDSAIAANKAAYAGILTSL